MAGQKPAGRNRTGGTAQGGASRTGGNRQGAGRPNQGRARQDATTKTAGNGAASAGSRSGAKQVTSATPARGATAVNKSGALGVMPTAAAGPLGRLGRLLSSVGFVPLATFVLSLYGLGASIYLTIAHYDTSVTLACSDKGLVNCAEVTTSAQSMVFGIFPVAVLGLAYYVFMTVLNSPWIWRLQQAGSDQLSTRLRYTRIGAVVAGIGFVLYLIYAELIQIGAICLWCTSVHVATFLIFALVVFYTSFSSRPPAPARRG